MYSVRARCPPDGDRKPEAALKKAAKKLPAPVPTELLSAVLLRKLVGQDKALEPGEYPVKGQVAIAVDCVVTKGYPQQAKQAYRPDWPLVLASICAQLGVKTDEMGKIIERAARAAYEGDVSQVHLDLVQGALNRASDEIVELLPLQERAGPTSVKGQVEIVGFEAVR